MKPVALRLPKGHFKGVGSVSLKNELDYNELVNITWCDNNSNELKTIKYGTNEIYCQLIFKNIKKSASYNLEVLRDSSNFIDKTIINVTKEINIFKLDITKILNGSIHTISKFNLKIIINHHVYYSKELNVHYVIFIPSVLEKLKWKNAARVQREWFNNIANNYPWEANPRLNFYDFEWALGFSRFKEHFDRHFDQWKSESSIKSLKNEINKMINDKNVVLPNLSIKETNFGVFDNNNTLTSITIKPKELNHKETTCNVPLFDKYYFSSLKPYEESISSKLDDFYGAIANTSIRIIASGILKYENNIVNIVINKIGFYIKDGFDFVGDQKLGYWGKSKVSKQNEYNTVSINNKNYRDYRKETEMGQDFYAYSTIKYYKINNFTIPL